MDETRRINDESLTYEGTSTGDFSPLELPENITKTYISGIDVNSTEASEKKLYSTGKPFRTQITGDVKRGASKN